MQNNDNAKYIAKWYNNDLKEKIKLTQKMSNVAKTAKFIIMFYAQLSLETRQGFQYF